MDESEDFYDDISKNLLPPQASSSAERGFDPLAPLAQEREQLERCWHSKPV